MPAREFHSGDPVVHVDFARQLERELEICRDAHRAVRQTEIAELRAQLAAAKDALKPFANFSAGYGSNGRDDDWVLVKSGTGKRTITMGDVRAARAALKS